MTFVMHLVLCSLSAVLLYVAAFLYEDEEKLIRNRLEDWWVRLDDASQNSLRRHAQALQSTAHHVTTYLTARLGTPLSPVSVSNAFLTVLSGPLLFEALTRSSPFRYQNATTAVILLVLAILPVVDRRLLFPVLALTPLAIVLSWRRFVDVTWGAPVVLFVYAPLSIAVYIVVLRATLRLLRSVAAAVTPRSLIATLVNLVLLLVLCWTPLLEARHHLLDGLSRGLSDAVLPFLLFPFFSVVPLASVPLAVFVAVVLTLPLHMILWGAVKRPAYAAARHNLLGNKKLLVASAVALLGVGAGSPLGSMILRVIELFK